MTTVLLVEDESDIQDLMALHLKREGFQVETSSDGDTALERVKENDYEIVVLDWMLPGASGLRVAREIRGNAATRTTPVLMVTARTEPADIVAGLEAGCDDYVTKPFEIPVFLARVRALLRRSEMNSEPAQGGASNRDVMSIGGLSIDGDAHEVRAGGEKLSLTPSEFKLIQALAKNQGRVLTREKLIELVQGEGVSVVDRAIDTHVFGLRKKLGEHADWIETVRGVGYRVRGDEK